MQSSGGVLFATFGERTEFRRSRSHPASSFDRRRDGSGFPRTISGAHPNMNIEPYIKAGDEISVMFRSPALNGFCGTALEARESEPGAREIIINSSQSARWMGHPDTHPHPNFIIRSS
jgi:hypothetical protein